MTPVLRLLVHCRVPIRVVKDHVTSPCEVEADTARARAADKAEDPGVVVEPLDYSLTELGLCVTI